MRERLRRWASALKAEIGALYLAARDPRTPWYAKAVAFAVVTYALSPIDLIPDVVPVLGYLDDLLIVPLGVLLAARLVPGELMAELRAAAGTGRLPASRAGAVTVVALWIAGLAGALWWLLGK